MLERFCGRCCWRVVVLVRRCWWEVLRRVSLEGVAVVAVSVCQSWKGIVESVAGCLEEILKNARVLSILFGVYAGVAMFLVEHLFFLLAFEFFRGLSVLFWKACKLGFLHIESFRANSCTKYKAVCVLSIHITLFIEQINLVSSPCKTSF